jgi:tetratricopeptide (TPR) repeat protein
MLAGQEMQYAKAAQLFAAALPGLPHDRKATAAYGLWFARSLAEPNRSFAPPSEGIYADDPAAALARAQAVAHLQGQAEAIKVLAAAEKRFPDDARLPAARASLALELDRRDEVKEALARAKALDPDDPTYLLTSAQFRETVSSDVDGALADLQHAAAIAPGISAVWNEIGIVQSDRNAIVEADRAHRRATSLNPENPALHANYARFLMDNDQVAAAKTEIDTAEAIDPHAYPVLAAKGRYLLRIGNTAEGEKVLLDASAVNPTYGDALIGLAIASYQQNETDETMQALDNADRFDPLNPSISLIRSGIALDQFQADQAIMDAREALRRRQLRGAYYSGYDTNRQAASFLGITLENLGLDEWGQYYAARAYDPFKSSTYVDEAAAGRLSPFVGLPVSGLARFPEGASSFSSQLQGELLDPLSIASETKRNSLERRSFVETTLNGSLQDQGVGPGWGSNALLQGTSYASVPVSYSIQGDITRPKSERENDDNNSQGLLVNLGIHPTLDDSFVLFGSQNGQNQGFPGPTYAPTLFDEAKVRDTTIGAAWSHVIEERNVVQMFAVSGDTDTWQQLRSPGGWKQYNQNFNDQRNAFGLSHILGIGPITLHYGIEATQLDSRASQVTTRVRTGEIIDNFTISDDTFATRSYVDATLDVSRNLQLEVGVYVVRFDGKTGLWGPVDPRLGAAWSFADGQWLRAYWRQDTQFTSGYTLSPISTVSLTPMELPLVWGGQTQTAAFRWDAEWTARLFTSIEYQHQQFNGLSLAYEDLENSFITTDGKVDRLNFSGNYWIGGGFGSFASLTLNHSQDLTPGFKNYAVPLVPDYLAQVGLKYVHSSRVTAAIAQDFVGRRVGGQDWNDGPIVVKLHPYTATDAAITWTSLNGGVDFSVAVNNIFDHRVESAFKMPAPGRTILVSLTAKY